MSALRNAVKLVLGSAIGAGVGYAASKFVEERDVDADDAARLTTPEPQQPRETFKMRLARAKDDGEAARAAKEAELRAYFRQKVRDPDAMTGNPTP
jgi:hypothetical protein